MGLYVAHFKAQAHFRQNFKEEAKVGMRVHKREHKGDANSRILWRGDFTRGIPKQGNIKSGDAKPIRWNP